MENTKTSMVFYESAYAAINYLPTTELKWEATQGLLNYGFYGIEPESDNPFVNMIYVQAIPSMRNAKERYNKAVDNGKKGGRPTEISTEQIMQMKKDGMTNKQIAEKLGCTVSNIENRITIYNKSHPNNPNNLSVSVSVSDSVSSSVSASASTQDEEERAEKRELEKLEERELESIKRDYKNHMSYNDIKNKYNLARINQQMCENIDVLLKTKVAERQEAEQRKDAELAPVYNQLATYLGKQKNAVKGFIKSLALHLVIIHGKSLLVKMVLMVKMELMVMMVLMVEESQALLLSIIFLLLKKLLQMDHGVNHSQSGKRVNISGHAAR